MEQPGQAVIVMDTNPQVLKGLTLLLEGMQFTVIAVSHPDELHKITSSQSTCPTLLLLPFEIIQGKSGMDQVVRIRAAYQHSIPTILLSHENGFRPDHFIGEDIVVLSDRITPRDLRSNIAAILSRELAV